MKRISQLLKEAENGKYTRWEHEWQEEAVASLNDYYLENGKEEEMIFYADSYEWADEVARTFESRGWVGLKFFLAQVSTNAYYTTIDAYGNGKEITGDDLVDRLKWAKEGE